jgi:hypothetical protein
MGSFTWTVADSTAFFAQSRKNNMYKLVFTKFEGSSTGKIVFDKSPLSSSGVIERDPEIEATIYPNPVADQMTIDFGRDISGSVSLAIFDITGKQVYFENTDVHDNKLTVRLPASSLINGLHLMKVVTGEGVFSSKFMVYKY